jgi:uncharacterized protein YegP (UPF0339 family)
MAGKYVLKKSGYQLMFNLKAGNNEIILTSGHYMTEAGARNGIKSAQTNSPLDSRYERRPAAGGQQPFCFVLKAADGETIGTSEMYTTHAARENGIQSCKTNGPTNTIEDET